MPMNKSRIMFLSGLILLAGIYFFPLWKISLVVPQYPQEIFINIRISKIENGSKKAMEIMNVLNHNIGMKEIDPDRIPELAYMPWILGVLLLLGLIAGLHHNRIFRISFVILTVLMLALAVYDLYLWQYDYGHNLSEDAPIRIEGGSFQPPLIGKKMVANLMVKSFPAVGAGFPVISLILMISGIINENKTV
jgi:copper chaperone NosL